MGETVRILSWNVNGLRAAARKGFAAWLDGCGADVVAIQEVRARVDQVPAELRAPERWQTDFVAADRAGYSGVGAFARRPWLRTRVGLGDDRFDCEGRLQWLAFGALLVVNGYFPNGNGIARDNSRIPYKLDFYRALFDALEADKQAGRPILVMGDFNTAPHPIDLARPQSNRETSGFTAIERAELVRWHDAGWVDTFRHYHPGETGAYSWWSQRFGVRAKNVGWRIDHILASPGAAPYLRGAAIHAEVMGSDHCPVSVDVDARVFEHVELFGN